MGSGGACEASSLTLYGIEDVAPRLVSLPASGVMGFATVGATMCGGFLSLVYVQVSGGIV